jgi:hypothetical protein
MSEAAVKHDPRAVNALWAPGVPGGGKVRGGFVDPERSLRASRTSLEAKSQGRATSETTGRHSGSPAGGFQGYAGNGQDDVP